VTEAEREMTRAVVDASLDPILPDRRSFGPGVSVIDMCFLRSLITVCLLLVEPSGYLLRLVLKQV
jgi:hypothetical protein